MAIGIRAKRADAGHDPAASRFFGAPALPLSWEGDYEDDEIFFCQIRLSDIAPLDTEGRLPHTGYLYVFLHTAGGDYALTADVRYYDGEPTLVVDDFNAAVEGYEDCCDAYLMEFYETDDADVCTRLFGEPSDWNYEDAPPRLFLQFDPLDSEMGFLDHLDGFLYFFFDGNDPSRIILHEEFS